VFGRSLEPHEDVYTAYTDLFVGSLMTLLSDLLIEPFLSQFQPFSSVVPRHNARAAHGSAGPIGACSHYVL
jgi:hypothetical protein